MLSERHAYQDGKHDLPAYLAIVLPRKEAEALNWARVEARVTIHPPPRSFPGGAPLAPVPPP